MERIILVQEEPRGPSELVEVPVTQNGLQRINLPDIQQLRSTQGNDIIIKGIRLIPAAVLVAAPTLGGLNAPDTELQKITLVIYCEGWEKGHLIPIFTLNDNYIEGSGTPTRFKPTRFANWKNVDWNKSYLQYANGQVSVGAPYNVLLDVEYERIDSRGEVVIGPK